MYSLFDEGESPADSGGVVGSAAPVGAENCLLNLQHELHLQPRDCQVRSVTPEVIARSDNHRSNREHRSPYKEEEVGMVTQEMAQGFTRLSHGSQEPQEFISLDELKPRILQELHNRSHSQNVKSADNAQHYRHPGQQQPSQQAQTYYNLSTAPESSCYTVYFGAIDAGVGEQAVSTAGSSGDGVAPNQTRPGGDPLPRMESESGSTTFAGHHFSHTNHYQHHHHQHQSQCQSPVNIQSNSCPDRIPLHSQPPNPPSSNDGFASASKKRKISSRDNGDFQDDNVNDARSVRTNDGNKKQNHSEIEKRRRDKMNTYITELSSMVPMCHAMSRKLDKLTVLRITVQHLKTILGAVTSHTEGNYKPAFLSDQELKMLILQVAEGFVFVVGCNRGRILYVSESVSKTLNYSQDDLLGQSWFDILHPKDVAKVKEQLSSSDLSPRERFIDAKTETDVPHYGSKLYPGARRSFFCRMKRKLDDAGCGDPQVKEEADTTTACHRRKKQQNIDRKYCVIQCTGYLKSWAPAKIGLEEQEGDGDSEACNLSCLVAIGRVQPPLSASPGPRRPHLRAIQFVSRHAIDGKFVFVDQRATLVLGFLPQELLGTSMYEYYHHDDIPHLAESHKIALQAQERVTTQVYRFRCKEASFVRIQSEWKPFKNPWTKDVEYLIAKNTAIFSDTRQVESSAMKSEGPSVQGNYDYFAQSNGGLERLITTHVEVSKIGRRIAEEVLDSQRRGEDSSFGNSPDPSSESLLRNTESQITTTVSPERVLDVAMSGISTDNRSGDPTPELTSMRNIAPLNNIANDQGVSQDESMIDMIGNTIISESPNLISTDGNDEAAMAVIMSLLEADAGLGGPVDFSGLPWPLP